MSFRAMHNDLQSMQNQMQSLTMENTELKSKLEAAEKQLEFEKFHLQSTINTYEKLFAVGKAKECVLWEYITRIVGESSACSSISEPVTVFEVGADGGSNLQRVLNSQSPKLDPNARAFVPFATASTSSAQDEDNMAFTPASPGASTQRSVSHASQEAQPPTIPAHQPPIFTMPTPMSPSILEAIIKSIPSLFRAVCPFSLTGTPCPLIGCQMKKLCPRFNHASGHSTCHSKNGCRHVHEHPTCLGEAEGIGCAFASNDGGNAAKKDIKGKGKMSDYDAARKNHMKGMVHQSQCGPDEWRLRLVMAGLRQVHADGLFKY